MDPKAPQGPHPHPNPPRDPEGPGERGPRGVKGTQGDPRGQGDPRAPSAPLGGMGPWGPLGLLRSHSEWKAISKCWVIAKGKSFRHKGRSESNHLKLWAALSPKSKWWKMVFGFLSIFQLGGDLWPNHQHVSQTVSFNNRFRGFFAFRASSNNLFRGYGVFQASFNNPFQGFWAFQASLNNHFRGSRNGAKADHLPL